MAQQVLKLDDPEGAALLVTRIDDVGYVIQHAPAYDDGGNPLPFRLLDDDSRRQLRDFLKPLG